MLGWQVMVHKTSQPHQTTTPVKEYIGSVTYKGMVTFPRQDRQAFKIQPRDKVAFQVIAEKTEIKPILSLEEAYGSVTPLNMPENFKELRATAI
jgi:bifunctional DNA-binding transcriptional regulator/antitoxin component of YhaV-PrlF toxin-antitoxin module